MLGATLTLMEAERGITRFTRDSFFKNYSAVNVLFLPLEYVQRALDQILDLEPSEMQASLRQALAAYLDPSAAEHVLR